MPQIVPYAALDYCKKFISYMDLDRLAPRLLDDSNKMFWMYAPWRWTLGLMAPVIVASNTQDYAVSLPTDFLFLQDVLQLDGKTTRHIKPVAFLPATPSLRQGQVSSVAVQTVNSATVMRVDPTPGVIPAAAPTEQLIGVYKKVSPVIDLTTMYTPGALLVPDEFFWVYLEIVRWKAMDWAQDPRAGETKVQQNQVAYSGQRAVMEAALMTCRAQEKLNEVDEQEEAR